jgi:hypothetical protein
MILKTCLSIILTVSGSHLVLNNASAAGNHHDSDNSDKVGNGLIKQTSNNSSNNGDLLADGVLLADGILASHGVLLANGVLLADRTQDNTMLVRGQHPHGMK